MEWISVHTKKPKNAQHVFVRQHTTAPEYQSAIYWKKSPTGKTGFFCGTQLPYVTHWAPLEAPND